MRRIRTKRTLPLLRTALPRLTLAIHMPLHSHTQPHPSHKRRNNNQTPMRRPPLKNKPETRGKQKKRGGGTRPHPQQGNSARAAIRTPTSTLARETTHKKQAHPPRPSPIRSRRRASVEQERRSRANQHQRSHPRTYTRDEAHAHTRQTNTPLGKHTRPQVCYNKRIRRKQPSKKEATP